jgi:hypothetical protein
MAGAVQSRSFHISPVNRLGRRIDPVVLQQIRESGSVFVRMFFLKKVNRFKRKQVVTVRLAEAVRSGPAWADPSAQFDMKILIDEFLAQCDSDAQDMFLRRIEGRSWDEIGRLYELSAQKRREFTEEEFLGFAKSYLSEAFPNPERIGCPPDSELKGLAEHPKGADPLISPHLTHCSPCFNRYMELLDEPKRAKPE